LAVVICKFLWVGRAILSLSAEGFLSFSRNP
jgi:hypothetical protein